MNSELNKLYELIEEIEIAMMTTRRPDGHLESRAMANQKVAAGANPPGRSHPRLSMFGFQRVG